MAAVVSKPLGHPWHPDCFFVEVMPLSSAHPSIVVVDDNEILLHAWEKILGQEGFSVFTTTNPATALDYLANEGADLLISDIVMPRTDGFDLVQQVEALPHKPKIILTTGYVCDFTRLKLEVDDEDVHVLLKPYNNIQELVHFVYRVLEDDPTLQDDEDSVKSLDDVRIHLWNL